MAAKVWVVSVVSGAVFVALLIVELRSDTDLSPSPVSEERMQISEPPSSEGALTHQDITEMITKAETDRPTEVEFPILGLTTFAAKHDAQLFRYHQFQCQLNTSAPLLQTRNKRGKVRLRRYSQTCASSKPPHSASLSNSTSFLFRSREFTPRSHVAVCMFGQQRRLKIVGQEIQRNLIQSNRADAYAATWPVPDDAGDSREMMESVQLLRHQFTPLVAARVEQLHPHWKLVSPFLMNSVYMYFLAEACSRLVLDTAQGHRYAFFIRVRVDLSFSFPLVVKQLNSSWELIRGKDSVTVPGSAVVMHHYTKCCANDWLLIGPWKPVLRLGFIYSLVMTAHTWHARFPNEAQSLHPAVRWCHGESCLQRSMIDNNISWFNADLGVGVGGGNRRANMEGKVCAGLSSCQYLPSRR